MNADEKNRSEILSRLLADLSAQSAGGEELASKIASLRDGIKKVIEHEDTIFGKFLKLVESFREIIPEEKQRFQAAMKALSATDTVGRQEIVQAVNNQLSELKILEKGMMSALPGWRDEIKGMQARSLEIKNEITKLRAKLGQLEAEDAGIRGAAAAREKDMELVEKAVAKLFSDMGAELTSLTRKVKDLTVEAAAPHTAPAAHPTGEAGEPAALQEKLQKRCPMCGGRMDFHIQEQVWKCYSCAYEETTKDRESGEKKRDIPSSPNPERTDVQKKCPMCGGQLNYHMQEKLWQCYTCAYEEPATDAPRTGTGQATLPDAPPDTLPEMDIFPDDSGESKKTPAPPSQQPVVRKKPCPVCHKTMNWIERDGAWRCPFCHYERRI